MMSYETALLEFTLAMNRGSWPLDILMLPPAKTQQVDREDSNITACRRQLQLELKNLGDLFMVRTEYIYREKKLSSF